MAMDSFEIFAANNLGSVRAVYNEVGNSLWFVAKDVCSCLGIKNSRQACKDFMNDEKADVILNDTSSDGRAQARKYTVVSEAGLYLLIMRSRKPEAKEFQRWVTRNVLPTLRKTGSYSIKESAYRNDAEHWYKMYCNILDDYVKDIEKRRTEEPKVTVPNNEFVEGIWTNKDMFVIGADGKYSIIEREMR